MAPWFTSKDYLLLSVFALNILLQGCKPAGNDPEPEVFHRIVGKWSQASYKPEIIVKSGKSLVDFFKDQGFTDEEAAFRAQTLLFPIEDNSVKALEFRKDGTYQANGWWGTGDGRWELSEDEKALTFRQSFVVEGQSNGTRVDVQKLTGTELDFIIPNTLQPDGGLIRRESYSFVKQ